MPERFERKNRFILGYAGAGKILYCIYWPSKSNHSLNQHYGKSVVHHCCYSRDRLGDRLSRLSCGRYHSHIVGYCSRSGLAESYPGFSRLIIASVNIELLDKNLTVIFLLIRS